MTASSPDPAASPDPPVPVVYWRPGCQFCLALRIGMWLARVPSRRVNIWTDPEAAARVRSVAGGNETVPTVFVGDRPLVNPSVRDVRSVLRSTTVVGEASSGVDPSGQSDTLGRA